MTVDQNMDLTPYPERMAKGLRDLSERIAREAPKRVKEPMPVVDTTVPPDFLKAANGLHSVEVELLELWSEG